MARSFQMDPRKLKIFSQGFVFYLGSENFKDVYNYNSCLYGFFSSFYFVLPSQISYLVCSHLNGFKWNLKGTKLLSSFEDL